MVSEEAQQVTNEEFYDQEIAPELLRLAKLCEARGMAFVCDVGFMDAEGNKGSTRFCPEGAHIRQLFTWWASCADGNADTLIWAMQGHAKKHGHSSASLYLLGTPTHPAAPGVSS